MFSLDNQMVFCFAEAPPPPQKVQQAEEESSSSTDSQDDTAPEQESSSSIEEEPPASKDTGKGGYFSQSKQNEQVECSSFLVTQNVSLPLQLD